MSQSASFLRLQEPHAELDEHFLLHQELLLVPDFERAAELLRGFRASIEVHMRHEEELLVPLLERVDAPRWPAELYRGQHDKLLGFLDRARERMERLLGAPGRPRRQVIELLEVEARFKQLLEHHDLAERQALYPECDRAIPELERRAILARCDEEWRRVRDEHSAALRKARRILES